MPAPAHLGALDYSDPLKDLQHLQAELQRERAKFARLEFVIAATGVGIWDWYVQSGETVFNERWADIIGYTLDELAPLSIETWMKFAHPDDLAESNRLLNEHWEGRSDYYIFESRMRHKEGHWVWVLDTGKVTEWKEPGVPLRMTGTHVDITAQKQAQAQLRAQHDELVAKTAELEAAEAKLRVLSATDPLTSLSNRRAFDQRLQHEVASARRTATELSVLLVDIDHFKQFNDTYGHPVGDSALADVASCLKNQLVRETDFVARLGGEEFVVLLPATDAHGAGLVAGRLRQAVERLAIPHSASPTSEYVTISIGLCSRLGRQTSGDEMIEAADRALYRAKEQGRNAVAAAAPVAVA